MYCYVANVKIMI